MTVSGNTLLAAEVGNQYGVQDIDDCTPKSDRETLGGPRDFSEAVVYLLDFFAARSHVFENLINAFFIYDAHAFSG